MPSSVRDLFDSAGVGPQRPIRFCEMLPSQSGGVYVVSLVSESQEDGSKRCFAPQLSEELIAEWLRMNPRLRLDTGDHRPKAAELRERMEAFWLPDEVVLYVGQTSSSLGKRLRQYQRTKPWERRPHAGGCWLKLVEDYCNTFVFWDEHDDPKAAEGKMLGRFVERVSRRTRERLRDPDRPFPFANLEYPKGNRKAHGILQPHCE